MHDEDASGVLDMAWFRRSRAAEGWQDALRARLDPDQIERLRSRRERGWPLASDRWIAKMERLVGRRLRPLPIGWPKGRMRPRRKKPKPKLGHTA